MELWTEYEGLTIDDAFPLKNLLLPEGRSAFFSTSNGNGVPTVIRLIASHFDEEEILARWRGVQALSHPNILKIERYGQLVLDDTTVVYAVFEPVDANLAEVIAGQRLTVEEVRQLASSLASALEALHMHGFVHEHVEPANVFAVGGRLHPGDAGRRGWSECQEAGHSRSCRGVAASADAGRDAGGSDQGAALATSI
jgi:hypothetical protein